MAVVVANDPIPSVSKKFVTAPIPISSGRGRRASVAGDTAPPGAPRIAPTARAQPATYTTVKAPSAVSSPPIGFMRYLFSPGAPAYPAERGRGNRAPRAAFQATRGRPAAGPGLR
jgi:hypothetical protein